MNDFQPKDDLARTNQQRWDELAREGVMYSQPWLDLSSETARARIDPHNVLGEVKGRRVLCLAGGGGQQSAAFALAEAEVTVIDLAQTQLDRDQQAASHYGCSIRTVQGDMRDLSCFAPGSFDIVYHAHSISFVPDADEVFAQVARVLAVGGIYVLDMNNPFAHGMEQEWTGQGYLLSRVYKDGAEVTGKEDHWTFDSADGSQHSVCGPREFQHTLSATLNALVRRGFVLVRTEEYQTQTPSEGPGSWAHFVSVAAPYLTFWLLYQPGLIPPDFCEDKR